LVIKGDVHYPGQWVSQVQAANPNNEYPLKLAVFQFWQAGCAFRGAGRAGIPTWRAFISKASILRATDHLTWSGAEEHLPENMADKPFEGVLIELKD
jgi:hypothetical protein